MKTKRAKNPLGPHLPGKPISQRGGCKVGWATFATEDEAKTASAWAIEEAKIKAGEGYDFGYCAPGSIDKNKAGYEVCLP